VGAKTWSATTLSGAPARARARMRSTNEPPFCAEPPRPSTPLVRTTMASAPEPSTARSPASFEAP